jgi:hypothetical protein
VKTFLWEGRESCAGVAEKTLEGKARRWGPEKARVHKPVEKSKEAPVISKGPASDSDQRNLATTKNQGQAGCTPGSMDSGNAFCGGERSEGILKGTKPKGRWVQALLSPAPHSVGVACLSNHGQVIGCEGTVSDKGVSTFNAKVELYNCREWLRRLRGEVDAGLQRLVGLLKDMDVFGPGQGQMAKGWVPKPKWRHEPKGKTIVIPKAFGVGLGSSPAVYKASGQPNSTTLSEATPLVGLGLVAGSSRLLNGHPGAGVGMGSGPVVYKESGQPKKSILVEAIPTVGLGLVEGSSGLRKSGLLNVGQSKSPKEVVDGPLVNLGLEAGMSGSLDKEAGSSEAGSAERASPTRLEVSGSSSPVGSSSKMVGVKGTKNPETSTTRGDTGLIELPLAMIGKELRLTTPVSSRSGRKAAATEPIQLRVYQRSRERFSKASQAQVAL